MKKNFFLITLLFIFSLNIAIAITNKIEVKIDNKIISSIDIENEIKYLGTLNPNFLQLNKKDIKEIAKNSLIKEIIKKNEILKNTENFEIDQKYMDILIKNIYSNLNIETKTEFLDYIATHNVDLNSIYEKITIESLWNQLIYLKFSPNIRINKNDLEKEIINSNLYKKSYLLYEIIFEAKETGQSQIKYNEILNDIKKNGFENAALKFSISDSSKIGGKIGWLDESSINPKLKNSLEKLNKNQISEPINIPGGFLILKIEDIKEEKKEINFEKELSKLINQKTNFQLNQYSNIYYNKIKQNAKIEEF